MFSFWRLALFCLLDLTPYFVSQNVEFKVFFEPTHKIFILTSHFVSDSKDVWGGGWITVTVLLERHMFKTLRLKIRSLKVDIEIKGFYQ